MPGQKTKQAVVRPGREKRIYWIVKLAVRLVSVPLKEIAYSVNLNRRFRSIIAFYINSFSGVKYISMDLLTDSLLPSQKPNGENHVL